ncbi:hypothetical protein Tco_1012333, partial [Tanacetum coccineum]
LYSSEYVAPPSIDIVRPWFETIGYQETVLAKRTLKKSLLPPKWSLANGINIDYASIFWEDIIIKLNNKHREKVVPYTRFLSLLMMHKMKEGYRDGEVTPYPTQFYNVNNWALKPNQPEGPPFTEHMLVVFSAAKPVVFKAPKPSSNAKRVPQGSKPGAKPEHKKHSTSLKQPYVSNSEILLMLLLVDGYFETLNIDASLTKVEAHPPIILIEDDDNFFDHEDDVPYDLTDSDNEVLANSDDDKVATVVYSSDKEDDLIL